MQEISSVAADPSKVDVDAHRVSRNGHMPPKKKGGKKAKAAEPVLTGPEAEAELERKMLIEEAKALKKQKEIEEAQYNEFQQEKVAPCCLVRLCIPGSPYDT